MLFHPDIKTNNRPIIRRTLRQKRLLLSDADCQAAALSITKQIVNTSWFYRSRHIAFYQAIQSELDPSYLMQTAIDMGKTCYLPVCHPFCKKTLLFLPYVPGDPLKPNRYGILEPDLKTLRPRKPFALDLVFMPLIAFDVHKNRLGSGQGYYDKTFSYLRYFSTPFRPILVGLAYDFQKITNLHPQIWDIPMNNVVVAKSGIADD